MKTFKTEINTALTAKSEEALEMAGELFEQFITLIQEEDFEDFESFYQLASFLIQDYWPGCGMFAEISSQLFAEYDIGAIDWIWQDKQFMNYCLRFQESDIHFGCFVLTEGRSSELFTSEFAKRALVEDCDICSEVGDGWLLPKAYVCQEPTATEDILLEYSNLAFNLYESEIEHEKHESLMMLRALAENVNTPLHILVKLCEIDDHSIAHEIRNLNSEMDSAEAILDSHVGRKARYRLEKLYK